MNDGGSTLLSGVGPVYTCAAPGVWVVTLLVTDNHGASDSDVTTVTCVAANLAPTADAGGSYATTVGASVFFDGSGSSDPDGSIASYAWSVDDGGPTLLSGVAPAYACTVQGTFTVTLTVADNNGATDDATTSVQCTTGNAPPIADAGGPYTDVTVGTTVQFDGGGSSDADGTIASYNWSVADSGPTPLMGVMPDYTCSAPGTFNVTLTVQDDDGATANDGTSVQCVPANVAPNADAGGPYNGSVGGNVVFNAGASLDPDGSIVSYTWSVDDGGPTPLSGVAPTYACTAPGVWDVALTVEDEDGATANAATTVNCVVGTRLPRPRQGAPTVACTSVPPSNSMGPPPWTPMGRSPRGHGP